MKGSNSRFSLRRERRYSNTAHVQGGMITDADLTEAGQLHQQRDEAQNSVLVGAGSPADNGVVRFDENSVTLQQGWVLAEGKQGRLVAASGAASLSGVALFEAQADLPDGPDMPGGKALLYADLWERPVFALQDDYLADAGLHGAETSYRTRTMVQVKALPLTGDMTEALALSHLAEGTGVFARKGNALASVTPKNTEIAIDDCDPCADQVDITPTLPNALFRIEVVEVTRDGAGHPATARFAWSMENAAVIETMDRLRDPATGEAMKVAFARDDAVYQYFSDSTEAQIGRFAPGIVPLAPEFSKTLSDKPFTHVRRWDGSALVNLETSTTVATQQMGHGRMVAAAGKASLNVDAFSVEIDYDGRELLSGDYWLIELRRFAPEARRVRLIGASDNKNAPPLGIEHHFCALFQTDGGNGVTPTDSDKRRLSFPALSDIPATHVSFDPHCDDFFDSADNVADALNSLCDLDATQIAFDPSPDCERFTGAKTVDQALKKLCDIADDTMLTRVLRTMMDWGVVCGLRLKLDKPGGTTISWSAGTLLDRNGRLIEVKAGTTDLRDVPGQNYQKKNLSKLMNKDGEICLSMAAGKDGQLEFFFTDEATAFGATDRSFREAVDACIKGRKKIDFRDIIRELKEHEIVVLRKLAYVSNNEALEGTVALNNDEAVIARAINKTWADSYFAKVDRERAAQVKAKIAAAKKKSNPNGVRGRARGIRRMDQESAVYRTIAAAEEEDDLACGCEHLFPPCPPAADKFAHIVPVACFRMQMETETLSALATLCDLCCRKQALTWRAYRYHMDNQANNLKDHCCHPQEPKPGTNWGTDLSNTIFDCVPYHTSRWVNTEFTYNMMSNLTPDITGLATKEAAALLTGNGFDLVDTLDLDAEGDPFEKLDELGAIGDNVIGRTPPEPGDKVIMLASGGKAVDFVLLQKGSGKLPFETEAETTTRVKKILASLDIDNAPKTAQPATPVAGVDTDLGAFKQDLDALLAERDKAQTELKGLAELRLKLAQDVGGLKSSMEEIAGINSRLAQDVEKSRLELNEITTLKENSLKDISNANRELAKVKAAQQEFVVNMRRDQPIESVLGNNTNAIKALKARGMVTVGDLEKANARTLTSIMAGTGMQGPAAKKLASNFVKHR